MVIQLACPAGSTRPSLTDKPLVDDEVRLPRHPRLEEGALVADYTSAADGRRAGRILLTPSGELLARLVATLE
jgi:hypothetical protein